MQNTDFVLSSKIAILKPIMTFLFRFSLMDVICWGTGVPSLFGMEKTITQYNIYLRFTVILFSLYPYSDNLSMYSIYRMRENRNQSHNDLHFSNFFLGGMPPPPLPHTHTHYSVASCLRHLQLIAPNIFITQLPPPPTFFLQMTPFLCVCVCVCVCVFLIYNVILYMLYLKSL